MDVHLFSGEGGRHDEILRARKYLPNITTDYAPLWAAWYQDANREAGEAPPDDSPAMRQFELFDELQRTADREEQDELFREIMEIATDSFWLLGIGQEPERTGVIADNFHNVPLDHIYHSPMWVTPGPSDPSQFFMSDVD
jgi:peptide/nickel transport system substrate-binding protein